MRILRGRRYHQAELEEVLTDDHAPPNQREAAMRLLLPHVEARPPKPNSPEHLALFKAGLSMLSTEELRWIVTDPHEDVDWRAAAHMVLAERDALKPPPDRLAWYHNRSQLEREYDRLMKHRL